MKLGVIGLGLQSRFRLEQVRLFDEIAAVIGFDPDPHFRTLSRELVRQTTARLDEVWSVPGLDAVLIGIAGSAGAAAVATAFQHGLRVILASPALLPAGMWPLTTAADGVLVLDGADEDLEHQFARGVLESGRLGTVRSVRYVTRGLRLPGHEQFPDAETAAFQDVLGRFAPALFARLMTLIGPLDRVMGQLVHDAAGTATGFVVCFSDAAGRTAQVDVQWDSLAGERTGWIVEGSLATLARKRFYSRMPDGEVVDQPAGPGAEEDLVGNQRWWHKLADREACRSSLTAAAWAVSAVAAVRESDRTGIRVSLAPWPELPAAGAPVRSPP